MSEKQIEKEKLKNTLLIIKQVLETEKDGLIFPTYCLMKY